MSVEIEEAMDAVRAARGALAQAREDLKDVREALGPPRRKMEAMRNRVRAACIVLDPERELVAEWRPPTKAEVGELDAANRVFLDEYAGALAEERRAKEAVSEWERRLKAANRDAEAARRKLRNRTRNPRGKAADHGQSSLF